MTDPWTSTLHGGKVWGPSTPAVWDYDASLIEDNQIKWTREVGWYYDPVTIEFEMLAINCASCNYILTAATTSTDVYAEFVKGGLSSVRFATEQCPTKVKGISHCVEDNEPNTDDFEIMVNFELLNREST